MASLKTKMGGVGVLNTIDSLAGGFAQGYQAGQQLQQQKETQDLKNKMLQLHIDQVNRQVGQQERNRQLFENLYPSEGRIADITRDIYSTPSPGELPPILTPQPPPDQLTGTPTTTQERIPLTPLEQLTKAAGEQETPVTAVRLLQEAQKAERESRMQALYERMFSGQGTGGLMRLEATGMHVGPTGPSFTFGKRVPPDPLKDLTSETKELVIKGLNGQGLAYKDFNPSDPQHRQMLDTALTSVQQNRDTTRQMKEESQALRESLGAAHLLIGQQGLALRQQEAAAKHSSTPLINRESGEIEFPSGEQLTSNPGNWIKPASPQDMTMYGLLRNIKPQVAGMKSLLDKVLADSPGANLAAGASALLKRGGGSTPELAAWDVLRSDIAIENTRALAGSARPPVMLLRLVTGQLPMTTTSVKAAKTELDLIEANADNRMRTIRGVAPQPLPVPGQGGGGGRIIPLESGKFKVQYD